MPENKNVITRHFDIEEHDDRAVFPMRRVSTTTYVIISKDRMKLFETDTTYVLELLD